jgi:hypothetical protein
MGSEDMDRTVSSNPFIYDQLTGGKPPNSDSRSPPQRTGDVLWSRPASAELLTYEPHFLPAWIRIHRVIEPISETYAWIATESGIEWV